MTQLDRTSQFRQATLHDRLLQAAAECATALLSDENFDRGMNTALEILATSAGIDRIGVDEHCDDPAGQTLGGVFVRYEWHSPDVSSQLAHPNLNYISYESVEDVYYSCREGQHWGGLVESLPEPFRSGQQELGVQSTYAVPIMVAGQYWGIIGLDYCQTAQVLGEAELAVLKTVAACIGSAIQRERNQRDRELAERQTLLEQQRSLELKERDRILTTTAAATQALLSHEDFDQAVNRAIAIIGEGIDSDRIGVMEHCEDTSNSPGLLKSLYEWHSPHTVSQLHHPELNQVSYAGVEDWYDQLRQGIVTGGMVTELPEPARSEQEAIGVKSTWAVPILVEGQYWGIVGFDHCREAKQLSEAEIAVLKTTSACIGSAIAQYRTRQAQAEAERIALLEQERSRELAERNRLLEERDRILEATAEAANVLLTIDDLKTAIPEALQILGEGTSQDRVYIFENIFDSATGEILWDVSYEWVAPGIPMSGKVARHFPISMNSFPSHLTSAVSQGEVVQFLTRDLNEAGRELNEEGQTKSLVGLPIVVGDRWWGVLGFDDCHIERTWSEAEIAVLKTAAACIGSAIQRDRIRQERETAAIERSRELEEHNRTLESREQWLEATAVAANALLSIEDLDTGIKEALRLIGETIDVDRVNVMQYIEDSTIHPLGLMRVLYEWHSPYASSQLLHPNFSDISAGGIEDLFIQVMAGEWTGGTIDEFNEPFRSSQIELGVQSTYSVPIFINGQFWGILGIDHCREKKRLSLAEIAVFKTAASCIGSAIQQNQSRQAREAAERAVLDERNRLARDIHDTLAQAFTGISLQLEAAKDILTTQPTEAQTHLIRAGKLARDGLAEARRSVHALRSSVLDTQDLPHALQQMLQTQTTGTSLHPELCIEGTPFPLPPDLETHLLRISQESLTNTLRHAQAQTIHLTLIFNPQEIQLQIRDDGDGFDPQQQPLGFGILGMQERVSQMGGQFTLASTIGQGTTISITVAIAP